MTLTPEQVRELCEGAAERRRAMSERLCKSPEFRAALQRQIEARRHATPATPPRPAISAEEAAMLRAVAEAGEPNCTIALPKSLALLLLDAVDELNRLRGTSSAPSDPPAS